MPEELVINFVWPYSVYVEFYKLYTVQWRVRDLSREVLEYLRVCKNLGHAH